MWVMAGTAARIDDRSMPETRNSLLTSSEQAAIDAADASIAVLDAAGRIVGISQTWIRFGAENGRPDASADVGAAYPVDEVDGLASVLAGVRTNCSIVYPCSSPDEERWFRLIAVVVAEGPRRLLVIHRRLADAPASSSLIAAGEEMALRWVGIRTICGWCDRQARDSLGPWRAIDTPLDGLLSHGVCPGCLERLIGPAPAAA
jgi:hypothetical protein